MSRILAKAKHSGTLGSRDISGTLGISNSNAQLVQSNFEEELHSQIGSKSALVPLNKSLDDSERDIEKIVDFRDSAVKYTSKAVEIDDLMEQEEDDHHNPESHRSVYETYPFVLKQGERQYLQLIEQENAKDSEPRFMTVRDKFEATRFKFIEFKRLNTWLVKALPQPRTIDTDLRSKR